MHKISNINLGLVIGQTSFYRDIEPSEILTDLSDTSFVGLKIIKHDACVELIPTLQGQKQRQTLEPTVSQFACVCFWCFQTILPRCFIMLTSSRRLTCAFLTSEAHWPLIFPHALIKDSQCRACADVERMDGQSNR